MILVMITFNKFPGAVFFFFFFFSKCCALHFIKASVRHKTPPPRLLWALVVCCETVSGGIYVRLTYVNSRTH